MLRVTILGSGSRGNAILVDGSQSTVLIDAGFGPRMLAKRLQAVGRRPEEISSLYLTHEHTDHACGAVPACRRWNWTLRATESTLAAMAESTEGCAVHAVAPEDGDPTAADGWVVQHTSVPHDSRDCSALVLTDSASGARVGVALDLGHVPPGLADRFARLDLLVVESNHDESMLTNGPYPAMLKRRIGGPLGHLSNRVASGFIAACVHKGLRGVMLAHLSETNNTPDHALACTQGALRRAGWRRDALWAASQRTPCGPVGVSGMTPVDAPVQLSLLL